MPDYPRIVEIGNVRFMLKAPINPAYHAPLSAYIFGGPFAPGSFAFDPSNGDDVGRPLRSPDGYPYIYAIGGDGYGTRVAIGDPVIADGDVHFSFGTTASQIALWWASKEANDARNWLLHQKNLAGRPITTPNYDPFQEPDAQPKRNDRKRGRK